MGLYNSEILTVNDGWVILDVGQQWTIDLARWLQIPGSSQPQTGQCWAIDVSSVANLVEGELPRCIQRTNDALDGMDDYFSARYGARSL